MKVKEVIEELKKHPPEDIPFIESNPFSHQDYITLLESRDPEATVSVCRYVPLTSLEQLFQESTIIE